MLPCWYLGRGRARSVADPANAATPGVTEGCYDQYGVLDGVRTRDLKCHKLAL
jgi:hypothetical protein